ncbi:MAG: cell wall-active antibiotics response protein [Acidobacteriia bacterium]|nr:cell wall-active antibiotics response protein [Terriglobia bacterium]
MSDQQPGGDLGDQIRRDINDQIRARMDARRARFEAKMERRRLRWQSRAYRYQNPFGGLLIGAILAGIGVLLLLQNLGVLYVDDLWQYWPVILIVAGGSRMVSAWDTGGRIFGGMLLFIGGVFLLHNLGLLHGNILAYFWPVVLIAVGLALLIRALEGNRAWDLWHDGSSAPPSGTPPAGSSASGARPTIVDIRNGFKEDHIFSGAKRRIETQEFEGGEALAVFGGIELDLRKADTKRDQVFIEANAIFGGIEIRVPEHWRIVVRGTGIFGGFADETGQMPGGDPKRPELIITGAAVFGGVSVKY